MAQINQQSLTEACARQKTIIELLEQDALGHGLALVQRGNYGRLMLNGKKLVFARGLGWENHLRDWLDGWSQSQKKHILTKISGTLEITIEHRQHSIAYHWVIPATLVRAFRQDLDRMVREHVRAEIKKGATRGLMYSIEIDGKLCVEVHGWWYSGDEEERLRANEAARSIAREAVTQTYLHLFETACSGINDHYDASVKLGEKCFLTREGDVPKRIIGHATQRYRSLRVPVAHDGRRYKLVAGPKEVGGIGDGHYSVQSSGGSKTDIFVPSYPE